jgi:hypothetical protein
LGTDEFRVFGGIIISFPCPAGYPPNTELLRSIAAETSGGFQPNGSEIFQTRGETTALPTPLWPYLAVVALLLYISDVVVLRGRIFE